MRHLLRFASIVFILGFARLACAQEPAKIVEQYVKAAGGGKALSKIQTLALEGIFTTDDEKSGTYTLNTKLPNRYYNSRLVNPKKEKIALAFVGHAQVHCKDALEVELASATGMKRRVFFDPQ